MAAKDVAVQAAAATAPGAARRAAAAAARAAARRAARPPRPRAGGCGASPAPNLGSAAAVANAPPRWRMTRL